MAWPPSTFSENFSCKISPKIYSCHIESSTYKQKEKENIQYKYKTYKYMYILNVYIILIRLIYIYTYTYNVYINGVENEWNGERISKTYI
jgi:hypothetical protein